MYAQPTFSGNVKRGKVFSGGCLGGYTFGFNGKENIDEVSGQGNWQDYGERMYDPRLGRFPSADPLIVKEQLYPELSPYQFASNTPIWGVDWDGLEVRVYTETIGVGHTFITVQDGDDVIVYTYGRYAELGKEKSSSASTTPMGQGVLIRLTGAKAQSFLQDQLYNKNAQVFEITDADEGQVKEFFENKFNSSSQIPTVGKYKDNPDARVIDEYKLFSNNCTSISCDAIQAGGSTVTEVSQRNGSGTGFTTIGASTAQKDFIVPIDFQNWLNMGWKAVKNVTGDMKEQIPSPTKSESGAAAGLAAGTAATATKQK